MKYSFYLIFLFVSLFNSKIDAQLSFPNGNKVDTVINVDVAYDETSLFFNTGKYKASNYIYNKILDSIHPHWLVTACFNGECRNELEQQGRFSDDFNLNDSTCFMAFHVESHGANGTSKIIYKVFNADDPEDEAYLEFNISYKGTTSIQNKPEQLIYKAYPNPAKNALTISLQKCSDINVKISDIQGKTHINEFRRNTNKTCINTSTLKPGFYFLQIQIEDKTATEKIVIE